MDHPNSKFIGSVYMTGQGIFCLDPRDQFVARSLIETGTFSIGEISRIEKLISPDETILLLGPHIGSLAIPLSKKVKNLVAVEANPNTHLLLCINKLLNGCSKLEIYHAAANHEEGEIEFVLNTHNSGGSKRMPLHKEVDFFYDNPQVVKVPAKRMDDLFKDRTFDLIFMDIEGSEYFAMKGMPELLARAKIVIAEFIPIHLSKVGGITVGDFLSPLKEFELMYVPVLSSKFESHEFEKVLTEMFNRNIGDAGIVFFKDKTFPRFEKISPDAPDWSVQLC